VNIGKKDVHSNYKLKAGQVWKYKNRPGEDDSIIRILKVEHNDKFGTLVHISVENLKLTNADNRDVTFKAVNYMVFDEKSIKDSVTELIKENDQLPDFEYNYNDWKKSFDQGMAGINNKPVANTLSILEEIMN
jgi:hypothetical protein